MGGLIADFASREDADPAKRPTLVINYRGAYRAVAGANTNREPMLEVIVPGGTVNLGELATDSTASGSTAFSIKTYLASGYNVSVDGTSLKNAGSGHLLAPMSTAAAAQPGVEQFGINLRDNSSPDVGSNPVQIPDNSFSFGTWADGYGTVNNYKYVAGQTIAQSASSSGQTNYIMSMIANVATTTPAGAYGGRLILNVIPTF
jgi:hypothetical protein